MKANFKSVLLMGQILLLGALCAGTFTACSSDDDPDPVQLAAPTQASSPVVTTSSITFTWNAVDNASQYAYVLKTAAGVEVKSGTVSSTTVTISDLDPNTAYVLTVTAVPATSSTEYLTSEALTISATTNDLLLVDKLVGTYASSTIGGDYYNDDWSWRDDVSFENTVTITKQDDNTLLFGNFYMDGYTLTVNVDNETGVVTVPIQTIAEYYDIILYNYYSEDIEVEVGYDLETGTITIPKGGDYSTWTTWAMRYNGYQYAFYVTTLTKQ